MAATIYSTGKFGVDDESTSFSLYVADFSANASSEQAVVADHTGADIGLAIFNPVLEIQASGVLKTAGTAATGITTGATLSALANLETYMFAASAITGTNTGKIVVTAVNYGRSNKDFEKCDFTAQVRQGVTATASILT